MSIMNSDSLKYNISNPAKAYLWEFVMPNPRGDGDTDTLRLRCQSAQLPERSFEVIHIDYMQTGGFNVPGRERFPGVITLEFVEGEDSAVWDAFYSWCELCVGSYDGVGVADPELKSDFYLNLLTKTDGTTYNKVKFIGGWVSKLNSVDLGYEQNKNIVLRVDLTYDRWEKV